MLQFMDGFDAGDFQSKWSSISTTAYLSPSTRFGYGYCLSFTSSGMVADKSLTPASKVIFGLALKFPALNDSGNIITFYGDTGVTTHINVRFLTSGAVSIYRGTAQIATSSGGVIPTNTWFYFEIGLTLSDTVGVVTARVNGSQVVTFTGDTKNAGTSTMIDRVSMSTPNVNMLFSIDDVYIADGTGSTNNDFIGDVRVQTLVPSGAGSSTQFTPVGSVSNWDNVEDLPYNPATYNYDAVSGHRDLFTMTDLLAGTTSVFAVQQNVVARKNEAGFRQVKTSLKSGSNVYAGTASTLGTSETTTITIRETDPNTSGVWSVSAVNAMESGYEVV